MSTPTNPKESIAAVNQAFMNLFKTGDAAGIADLYTENGQFLPPNSDFVTGREAVQATFQSLMDQGIKNLILETIELECYGETATEVGIFTLEDADGTTIDHGKLVVIWKQESGEWKLHRDIINSSVPAE